MERRYFVEEDENINIDVQVGPDKEIDVDAEPEEAVPTPVDMAKAAPENVPIAAVAHDNDDPAAGNDEPKLEFYVDARDVEKYADLNEMTMLNALNSIIYCHENSGMRADNTIIVLGESTMGYARNLEKHGAAYMFVNEAEGDIQMDVQVGPNGDDMSVEADPQEANPVDAVKRQYDNVVVAKQGDEFFMDVEDVQKCADLNCESVIKTLNGIISVNEDTEISADNMVLICKESNAFIDSLVEAGVDCRFFLSEAGTKIGDVSGLNALTNKIITNCKSIARKLKGDVDADKKKIQEQIDHMDKLISRIDEEIEAASKDGYKPSVSTIAKNFLGFTMQLVEAMVYMGSAAIAGRAIGGKIGMQFNIKANVKRGWKKEDAKSALNKYLATDLKNYSITLAALTAVISPIFGGISTAVFMKDYIKSLNTWKANVESVKEELENKLQNL